PKCTVSLMTIHKSKGLEFPNVFVSGVCSGLLPLYKSKKDWDEELRLLYVAMTRAENWLCLSSYEPHGRSEFLSYIPSSLLKTIKTRDNIRIPPKPEKMERAVTKESSDYIEPLPEKLLGAGMTVIGIDPGNVGARETNVGWSVTQKTSDGYSVLDYNTEHPCGKKEDKLKEIERKINSLVAKFPPDAVAVEKIEVAIGEVEDTIEKAKAKWFHYVARCVATIRNIADRHGIECRLYTAQDVKYAATDNRSANKEQVKAGVKKRCTFRISQNIANVDDHSADAIAASLCYLRSYLNSARYEGNRQRQEQYDAGCDYFDERQYKASVHKFKEAINIDPIYTDAHYGLGRASIAQGDLEAAEDAVKTALRLAENNHPDSQKLLDAIRCYRLGQNAVNNKQFNEAITKFQESIHLEPFFINAHYELGKVHLRLSNLQEAKDVVEEALKIADDYPSIQRLLDAIKLYNAGLNFLNDWRYNDAIDKLKEAIDKEPIFIQAHYRLGLAYFGKGALEASEQSANNILEFCTDHQLALALLDDITKKYKTQGLDLIAYGRYVDAIEPLQNACTLNQNDREVWANLGCAYYFIDEYVNAASCYRKVTDLDPKDKNAYSNLGNAYFRMGAYADAIEPLQNACELKPNCGKFHYYLGRAQFKLDRLREAKWAAEKALEIDQGHHPTAELLKRIEKRSHEIIRRDNPDMILISAGEFQMGCGDRDAPSNEKPIHTVYLDDFYIDKYPVTNAQYKRFIDANPQWRKDRIPRKYHNRGYLKYWRENNYPSGKTNHPIVHVSWYAAMAYAQWVGKRLPTEAEWEKAARGGLVSQRYPWGDLIDSSKANYNRNVRRTTPVGDYPANNYGLYDMAGNVWEWCLDRYNEDFYVKSPCHNPVAGGTLRYTIDLFRNVKSSRVLRGGSWSVEHQDVRSTARTWKSPDNPCPDLGFRCVMSVIP
ncbi:SUMF1/EgtB/PvdO family nonheme iron enzyme, partial [Candidatus Poribacteria bacterium]|nr:SUMF1/EgtB/PvdO family nonheme iron enzyme [Candidatus Poribacteria bacterium]